MDGSSGAEDFRASFGDPVETLTRRPEGQRLPGDLLAEQAFVTSTPTVPSWGQVYCPPRTTALGTPSRVDPDRRIGGRW